MLLHCIGVVSLSVAVWVLLWADCLLLLGTDCLSLCRAGWVSLSVAGCMLLWADCLLLLGTDCLSLCRAGWVSLSVAGCMLLSLILGVSLSVAVSMLL